MIVEEEYIVDGHKIGACQVSLFIEDADRKIYVLLKLQHECCGTEDQFVISPEKARALAAVLLQAVNEVPGSKGKLQ